MKLPADQPNLLYGIILSLGAYFCFAIAAAIVKNFDPNFPTIEIIFTQCFISLFFILPNFFKKRLYLLKIELIPLHLIRAIS